MFKTFYVNKELPLVITNVYFYDIGYCYYSLLTNLGFDLSHIDFRNKLERNIYIGKLQIKHKFLSKYLQEETCKIMNNYLIENNIPDEDVIMIQRDGIYIKDHLLKLNSNTLPLDYIYKIIRMIFDLKKSSFIFIDEKNKTHWKGISKDYYDPSFLDLFKSVDYRTKKSICNSLDNIRKSFLFSNKKSWFVKYDRKTEQYFLPIKNIGLMKFNELSSLYEIDDKEIDKLYIWNSLCWSFCQSILINYVI